jgi:hypothetical protein
MSKGTGVIFSYAIGLIFAVGGVVFMVFLEENRFLFGVPYLLMGLVIVVGLYHGRRKRRLREEAEAAEDLAAGGAEPAA